MLELIQPRTAMNTVCQHRDEVNDHEPNPQRAPNESIASHVRHGGGQRNPGAAVEPFGRIALGG